MRHKRWVGGITIGGGLLLVSFIALKARDPGLPYAFLNGRQIVHSRTTQGGKQRIIQVHDSYDDLVKTAEREIGRPLFSVGDETLFKWHDKFLAISRQRREIASVNPLTNRVVFRATKKARETITVRFSVQPTTWDQFRFWLEGLFSQPASQRGTPGRPTPPSFSPE